MRHFPVLLSDKFHCNLRLVLHAQNTTNPKYVNIHLFECLHTIYGFRVNLHLEMLISIGRNNCASLAAIQVAIGIKDSPS